MTPFATPLYFGLVSYVAAPTALVGLLGRLRGWWILAASLVMAALQLGWNGELAVAVVSIAIQLAAVYGFRVLRARGIRMSVWPPLILTLAPLFLARLTGISTTMSPIGFVGLSYVTFRVLDVILGVHDGTIKELDGHALLAYLVFFPTLSSGPIDRYRRFVADFRRDVGREGYLDLLNSAVPLMIRGLLYKFVIADYLNVTLLEPLAGHRGLLGLAAYMYAYTAFLFFDFAGYSAMAIAVSRVFGIATPTNFDRPFLARNIVEFWNRWHMSLSMWFRDHVYMRLLLAAKRGRWFQDRHLPSYLALLASFGLMGLWHGLAWHYVVYGLYHALLQIAFSMFSRWNASRGVWGNGPVYRAAGTLVTAQAFAFGLLIFSGRLF